MAQTHNHYLYNLNSLIAELKECGWNDEAAKLTEVREMVWSEDLVFTPAFSDSAYDLRAHNND